jgi:hypothetical protein
VSDMVGSDAMKAEETAMALSSYLDDAGISTPVDRIAALRRHYAATWLFMLRKTTPASALTVWDVSAGRDLLIARMEEVSL